MTKSKLPQEKLRDIHAKALKLHGRQSEVVKLNRTDYPEASNLKRLIGPPPGYVPFDGPPLIKPGS